MKKKKKSDPTSLIVKPCDFTWDDLTPGQKGAYKEFLSWFKSKKKKSEQVYRIGAGSGAGKAQPVDIMIPTPTGMKRFGDLKVGDYVFNRYGKPTEVIGIYPRGKRKTYKVTFTDGRFTYCCDEHLWAVAKSNDAVDRNKMDRLVVKTLSEIMEDYEEEHHGDKIHKYYIPMSPCVHYEHHEVPIDPYVVGAFIGNGALREGQLSFSTGDPASVKLICKKLGLVSRGLTYDKNYTYTFRDKKTGKSVSTKSVFGKIPELMGKYSHEKRIPDIYKYNSRKVRIEVLKGLLDTDGTIDNDRYRISYTTTSSDLCNDIVDLCRSLGFRASVRIDKRTAKYTSGVCYQIGIRCPDGMRHELFSYGRKRKRALYADEHRKTRANMNWLQIKNIEYVGKTKQQCIMVDNPDHLYITENFIVTHNTAVLSYIVESMGFTTADCIVAAYTGQAVNVLRQKGVLAKTIHSSFMRAIEEPLIKDGEIVTKRGIPIMITKWKPIKRLPSEIKLIIIDEASFISTDIENLITSYGVPVLEIGDPYQLPPVTGKQCFRLGNLNYYIQGVVRQKEDSLIYRLSRQILNGEAVDTSQYHGEVQFLYAQEDMEETFSRFAPFFQHADLIVTATNKQRQAITDCYREKILKAKSPYPMKGEKMICRRNDWQLTIGPYPLTNGTIGTCLHHVARSDVDSKMHTYTMDFRPDFIEKEYFDGLECDSDFLREPFGQDKVKPYYTPGLKFEYAHAISVHLCQGCTADSVIYVDSFNRNEEYHMRQRYTAITRARSKLWFIIPRSVRYPGWFDLRYPKKFDLEELM